MPRRKVGERSRNWYLATLPRHFHVTLKAKHKQAAKYIQEVYDSIDALYGRVAKLLDDWGIIANQRGIYRSFAEECWRLKNTFTGETLVLEGEALAIKYMLYGLDPDLILAIADLTGVPIFYGS